MVMTSVSMLDQLVAVVIPWGDHEHAIQITQRLDVDLIEGTGTTHFTGWNCQRVPVVFIYPGIICDGPNLTRTADEWVSTATSPCSLKAAALVATLPGSIIIHRQFEQE